MMIPWKFWPWNFGTWISQSRTTIDLAAFELVVNGIRTGKDDPNSERTCIVCSGKHSFNECAVLKDHEFLNGHYIRYVVIPQLAQPVQVEVERYSVTSESKESFPDSFDLGTDDYSFDVNTVEIMFPNQIPSHDVFTEEEQVRHNAGNDSPD